MSIGAQNLGRVADRDVDVRDRDDAYLLLLYEGADARYVSAHDQCLHRLGALERVQCLDVR